MKHLIFSFLTLLILGSCNKESVVIDPIEETQLYGIYDLEHRMWDGVTCLIITGETLHLYADNIDDDMSGLVTWQAQSATYEGSFSVNEDDQSILFSYGNWEKTFTYTVDTETLVLVNDQQQITERETWNRITE